MTKILGVSESSVATLLRATARAATEYNMLAQAVASQLGIGQTDLECLTVLQGLGPASAGQLADVLGLTTGAITGVVDRLVHAGFALRESDPADRRRVIVRPVPERMAELERAYQPLFEAATRALPAYTDQQVNLLVDFQSRTATLLRRETDRLKSAQSPRSAQTFSSPLGDITAARLEFSTGAASVRVDAAAPDSELYHAAFEGAQPSVRLQGGNLTVRYKRLGVFDWGGSKPAGRVSLNSRVPWSIAISGGATAVAVDARELALHELKIEGGANKLEVFLPAPRQTVPVCIDGGLSRVQIEHPGHVPVQLIVQGGANRLEFDEQRFGAVGGHLRLASPGWELASDRYVIEVHGGASRLAVQGV